MNIYERNDISDTSFNRYISTSNQHPIFDMLYYNKNNKNNSNDINNKNKYKYIKKIYEGYASILYIAKDLELDKNVIIKKVSKQDEPTWREELYILKYIKDNSKDKEEKLLLQYIDFFENELYIYIIFEYYDNFDLSQHVYINCPYPENYAKKIIKEMARCIKACHDINIIHLDIKCENFIVKHISEDIINVMLIDFGQAEIINKKNADKIIYGGFSYGTNEFLCPESHHKYFSKKNDIWALGICAILILTGSYIFNSKVKHEQKTIHKIEKCCIENNLSENATKFIKKCLTFDPLKRPTIDELLQDDFLLL